MPHIVTYFEAREHMEVLHHNTVTAVHRLFNLDLKTKVKIKLRTFLNKKTFIFNSKFRKFHLIFGFFWSYLSSARFSLCFFF